MFGGVLLSFAAGVFHPDRQPANDHLKAFNALPTLIGIVLVVAWSTWLLVRAWRKVD